MRAVQARRGALLARPGPSPRRSALRSLTRTASSFFSTAGARIRYAVSAAGFSGCAPETVIESSPFRHHVGASAAPLRAEQTSVSTPRVVGIA